MRDEQGRRQTSAIDQFSPLSLWIRYVVRQPLVGCNICVWITFRGMNLFVSFDTDESPELLQRRRPGLYEASIPLPMEILKAGSYAIGLDSGIINNGASRADHQHFESLLTLEVREAFATSLERATLPARPGAVALRLEVEHTRFGPGEQWPPRARDVRPRHLLNRIASVEDGAANHPSGHRSTPSGPAWCGAAPGTRTI